MTLVSVKNDVGFTTLVIVARVRGRIGGDVLTTKGRGIDRARRGVPLTSAGEMMHFNLYRWNADNAGKTKG